MALTEYVRALSAFTGLNAAYTRPDLDRLTDDIQKSAIITALDHIVVSGTNYHIWFKAALSTSAPDDVANLDAVVAAHTGEPLNEDVVPVSPQTDDEGVPMVALAFSVGSKVTKISHNFCDKSTWHQQAVRKTAVAMTEVSGTVFRLPADKGVLDVTNGKIFGERDGENPLLGGVSLRTVNKVVVRVDAVEVPEQNLDNPTPSSPYYTVDYATGRITFDVSQTGKSVEIDYSEIDGAGVSEWELVPSAGKELRIAFVELQFASDAEISSAFIFRLFGKVGQDPRLNALWDQSTPPGPFPTGYEYPLREVIYQGKRDMIAESNRSYPTIPQDAAPGARGLDFDCQIFVWDYPRAIQIRDDWGNRLVLCSENDTEAQGSWACAAIYGESSDIS